MNVYRIHAEYDFTGGHYAHWIDDGATLMETPQDRIGSVLPRWPSDLEFEVVRDGNDCDVYFNASGLIYSRAARDAISLVCLGQAQWLPLTIAGLGDWYLFHPVFSVPLGSNARFRQHNPGDNIVEIYEYDFDEPDALPTCFLIPQPESSPAGKTNASCTGIYVTDAIRDTMSTFRGLDFAKVYPS